MDRQRHVAVWLRMLATKEIAFGRQSYRLLKSQSKKAKEGYQKSGFAEAQYIIKEGQNDWMRLLVAHYTNTTKDLINYTFDQLGAKKASFQDIVQAYIARNALQKSTLITGTTLELMKAAILKGQQDGLGETDIANAISESIGGQIAESRARTIARTEIHNAATYGMQTAAEETEQRLTREWVAVHDERTREAHANADGQQRAMDEPFNVDGESIDRPGEGSPGNSINCRCTLIYIPETVDVTGDSSGDYLDGS